MLAIETSLPFESKFCNKNRSTIFYIS